MEKYRLAKVKYLNKNNHNLYNWTTGAFLGVSLNNRQFWNQDSLIQILNTFKKNVADGSFKIVIGDYLDRYNEIIFNNCTEEEAIKVSLAKGDVLIKKIKKGLKMLNINNYSIVRTQDFHKQQDFPKLLSKYLKIYEHNILFKNIIDKTVEQFFGRMQFDNNSIYNFQLGVNYLIEELAIFEMLINNGNYINIYPGKHLQVLKDIVKGEIEVSDELKKYILVQLIFVKTTT